MLVKQRVLLLLMLSLVTLFVALLLWQIQVLNMEYAQRESLVRVIKVLPSPTTPVEKARKAVDSFVESSRRPLLVRFDWYSRKKSPIHIGYVWWRPALCRWSAESSFLLLY